MIEYIGLIGLFLVFIIIGLLTSWTMGFISLIFIIIFGILFNTLFKYLDKKKLNKIRREYEQRPKPKDARDIEGAVIGADGEDGAAESPIADEPVVEEPRANESADAVRTWLSKRRNLAAKENA